MPAPRCPDLAPIRRNHSPQPTRDGPAVKTIGFGVLAGALLSQPATALDAQKEGGLDGLIAQHAKSNGVPADLVHRVIKRESRYNPRAVGRGGAMGLMQIKHGTARALGYAGTPVGLLSAETNLTYGVRYLAGAYKVANGDPNRAVAFFARGYYYDAKRKGMLASLASGKAQPVQVEAEAAVPDAQQQTASIGFSMVAPVPSSHMLDPK
jgi:soluble lytic murein transglycosylase-like protein